MQKLFRFTDAVVFSFDGDSAGRRAARKVLDAALPFATDLRSVKFLFLPEEHDPDSFIRAHGKDGFAAYVAKAVPLSRFMLEAATEGCELDSAEGRAHMASNGRPLWGLLLTDPQSWDAPNGEEHLLLCELPVPHGPLFVWLERQLHEHGPQPWAALRSGGFGTTHEAHPVGPKAIEILAPN